MSERRTKVGGLHVERGRARRNVDVEREQIVRFAMPRQVRAAAASIVRPAKLAIGPTGWCCPGIHSG